jgi:tetratricopeptide (TPR) repeat protein
MGITESLNIDAKFRKATAFIQQGNTLAAIQIYKNLLLIPEAERKATIKLADIYDQAGNLNSAVELFEAYLKHNSDDSEIIKLVSYFLVRNSLFTEARRFINKFDIKDENMDFLRGVVNFHTQKFVDSHKIFTEFITKYNSSELLPSVLFYLSKIYFINSDFDSALKAVKKSIELLGDNPEAYKLEADIYFNKEMYYHANESIGKALKLNPSVIAWRHFQIKILILLDEINKVKEKLHTVIDESPSSAEILYMIGKWHLQKNEKKEANRYFAIAETINQKLAK